MDFLGSQTEMYMKNLKKWKNNFFYVNYIFRVLSVNFKEYHAIL